MASELSEPSSASKRRNSFRRLASSMKERVQTLVSNIKDENNKDDNNEVPSAVNPSKAIRNAASIDVSAVLHDTNCYRHEGRKRNSEAELFAPRIVVTQDIRNDKEESRSNGDKAMLEPRRFAREDGTELRRSASLRQTSRTLDARTRDASQDASEQMRMQLAMLKIKEAILSGDAERRNSGSLDLNDFSEEKKVLPRRSSFSGESSAKEYNKDYNNKKKIVMRTIIFDEEDGRGQNMSIVSGENDSNPTPNDGNSNTFPNNSPPATASNTASRINDHSRKGSNEGIKDKKSNNVSGARRRSACGDNSPAKRSQVRRTSSLRRAGSGKRSSNATQPMIWEYFAEIPNHPQHGRCKTCQMSVSCKFNTGNFVRHLQLTHKDVYRQYHDRMENAWTRSMLQRNLK